MTEEGRLQDRRMFKIILFVFTALGQSGERVENGAVVSAQNALSRSIALMKFSNGGTCSAAFLTKTALVTAAHCTRGATPSSVTMRIRDSKGTWHSVGVSKLISHPQFNQSESAVGTRVRYDIGLILLKKEFPIAVRPVKIGAVGDMVTEKDVTVAGYGWNAPQSGSGILRTGKMKGIVQTHYNFYNREGIYMVPKTNQAVCPGDSGGAVLKGSSSSTVLIGVNSLSNACQGADSNFSISEIVSDHTAWIKKHVSGM